MRHTTTKSAVQRGKRLVKKSSRNRKRPNYKLLFSSFLISILLSASITYAFKTPNLDVKSVSVKGVSLCDKQLVEKYAGSMDGKNILCVRKGPVRSAIMTLNEVESVKIGREFPDRMWVHVTERKPDAVISDGRSNFLIQCNGLVFHKTNSLVNGIPRIDISGSQPLQTGDIASSEQVRGALEIVKSAKEKKLRVGKISIDHDGDICLNMVSGFYVKLGQPDDIARKMSLLRRALEYRPSIAREAIYIDLSCPSAPVWKPKIVAQNAS